MSRVRVLIKVSPEYNGTKVSYFSDSTEEECKSLSVPVEEEDLGVTIFARVSDLSPLTTILREIKKTAARTAAASTNKSGTVFDFIFYKYIVN